MREQHLDRAPLLSPLPRQSALQILECSAGAHLPRVLCLDRTLVMTAITRLPRMLRSHRRGASLVENGLLVGLVAVIAIAAITALGFKVGAPFCRAAALVSNTDMDCASVTVAPDGAGSSGNGSGGNSGGAGEAAGDPDDGLPDVAGLSPRFGWPGVTETFGGIRASGFDGQLPIAFVDPESDWLMTVNGAAMGQGPFMIEVGDTIAFTLAVPASGVTRTVGFRIGDAAFALSVTGGDVLAEPFTIPAVSNAMGATWTESKAVTPVGFDVALPIAVAGQDARLYIGGSTTGVNAGTLAPGQSFRVGMTSGAEDDEAVSATVTLGVAPDAVVAPWSVTAADLTPDAIVLADTRGHIPGDWAWSGTVEVTGIDDAIPVAMSAGAQVSVNDGPWSTAASVGPYDSVRFRQRIPGAALADATFSVSGLFGAVGGRPGVTATWTAVAGGSDRVPDAFTVPALLTGEPNARNVSGSVVLSGFDAATQIRVTGEGAPLISIDGGSFIAAGASPVVTIRPGQTFEVSVLGEGHGSTRLVIVEVSSFSTSETVSATWTATVRDTDTTPDAGYRLANVATPQVYKATVSSETLAPTGFNDPIDIVVSGAHASDTTISVNGGPWSAADGSGRLATLQPGDSFRLSHYVALATGADRSVRIKVGDAPAYDWTIATLDMLPASFMMPDQGTLTPSAARNLATAGGERWKTTISGLGPGVSLPLDKSVHRFATLDPADTALEIVTSVRNGDIIGYSFAVPASPGATLTETVDFGGMIAGFDYAVSAVPTDPRYYQFPWLFEQPYGPNQRNWSEWLEPTRYGAPMQISFDAGSDASARYQVWRRGAANPDSTLYQSVTISPGDRLRVSVVNAVPSATGIPAILHFHSASNRTYTWRSRTTASTDQTPTPLADIGIATGPHSIYANFPCTRIHSTNSATAITGFDGQITVRLEDAEGRYAVDATGAVAGARLGWAGTAGYATTGAFQYNGSVNVNLCLNNSGTPPAGETVRYRIVAGHPTDPAQQVSTIQTIVWAAEDQDPGAFVLGPDVTDATPGGSYAISPIQLDITGPVAVSIAGHASAAFSVNAGAWQTTSATIRQGDTLGVRLVAAGADGSEVRTATLHVDGYTYDGGKTAIRRSASWSVTPRDTTPDPIGFVDVAGRTPGTWVASGWRIVSGIDTIVPFTVLEESGRAEINASGNRVRAGTLQDGDSIRLWRLLDEGHGAGHLTRIVIGTGAPASWTATTRAEDRVLDAFSWPTSSDEPVGEAAISAAITLSGFADPGELAFVAGPAGVEISIAGEDWIPASSPGLTVAPGQDVRLRWTPTTGGEIRTIEVSVGGIVGSWTVYALP